MAAEKVMRCGIERIEGFLYYVDKEGDISRVAMARGKGKKAAAYPKI